MIHIHRPMYSILMAFFQLAVTVFAAVDQDLSDRIAKKIGVSTVKPLQVKPKSSPLARLGLSLLGRVLTDVGIVSSGGLCSRVGEACVVG